jgi:hypothetical protein
MTRPRIVFFICLLGSLFPALTASAQDIADVDRRTLKGIEGVRVDAGVAKDIEEAGLRPDVIKTDTELELRRARIRVLDTDDDFSSTPGSPWLYVTVEGVSQNGVYGYYLGVSLTQNIVLERDPMLRPAGRYQGITFSAQTWDTAVTGVQIGNPTANIRSSVKDLVGQFINAYLSANKKSS